MSWSVMDTPMADDILKPFKYRRISDSQTVLCYLPSITLAGDATEKLMCVGRGRTSLRLTA